MKTVISTVLSEYMELLTKTPYDCPLLVPPKSEDNDANFYSRQRRCAGRLYLPFSAKTERPRF